VQRPHDEPPTLALSWATAGASACPSRAALLERIAAHGVAGQIDGWVPDRHGQARLAVEVEVAVEGDRWRASLSLTDADGRSQRGFSAASCEALADATALIVAVTLDPVAVASSHASVGSTEPEPPESEPEPKTEPKPEPEAVIEAPDRPPIDLTIDATSEPEPEPGWPEDLRVGLALHGGVGWGPVGDPAPERAQRRRRTVRCLGDRGPRLLLADGAGPRISAVPGRRARQRARPRGPADPRRRSAQLPVGGAEPEPGAELGARRALRDRRRARVGGPADPRSLRGRRDHRQRAPAGGRPRARESGATSALTSSLDGIGQSRPPSSLDGCNPQPGPGGPRPRRRARAR